MITIDEANARVRIFIREMKKEFADENFDLILAGDGSGTTYEKSCGWFVSASRDCVTFHSGCRSDGTSNVAELLPYLQALEFYHAKKDMDVVRVLIISDSELTVRCGCRQYGRNANLSLWSSMDWFEANGYSLTWRHTPRNKHLPHKLADCMAKHLRCSVEGFHGTIPHHLTEIEG